MGKFCEYVAIGSVSASIIVGEQHPHIQQDGPAWPASAFRVSVVAVTTSSFSTYMATAVTTFGR